MLAAALAAATLLFAWAAPAGAHVTVTAPGAAPGGTDQEITFRVPVEEDVDTIGLELALPTDTPIASVLVAPVPGWTHAEKTVRLAQPIVTDDGNIDSAVAEIDWRAGPGHGLHPGEFGEFTIIAGRLPDVSSLTFKAIQLYSDGSQVAWTQTQAPGSTAQLVHPAPVLTLAAAPASRPATSSGSHDAAAVALAIAALVTAAAALGVTVVTRARTSTTRGSD
jgi:uncharacterized protein